MNLSHLSNVYFLSLTLSLVFIWLGTSTHSQNLCSSCRTLTYLCFSIMLILCCCFSFCFFYRQIGNDFSHDGFDLSVQLLGVDLRIVRISSCSSCCWHKKLHFKFSTKADDFKQCVYVRSFCCFGLSTFQWISRESRSLFCMWNLRVTYTCTAGIAGV